MPVSTEDRKYDLLSAYLAASVGAFPAEPSEEVAAMLGEQFGDKYERYLRHEDPLGESGLNTIGEGPVAAIEHRVLLAEVLVEHGLPNAA